MGGCDVTGERLRHRDVAGVARRDVTRQRAVLDLVEPPRREELALAALVRRRPDARHRTGGPVPVEG